MKRECDFRQISDDKQLKFWLKQMAEGDTQAFKLLYEALYQAVFLFVFSHIDDCDCAEDLVQDTFISVYQSASQYQGKSRIHGLTLTGSNLQTTMSM